MEKDADSFRNKKLFDFNFNDPSKIEINGAAYSKSGSSQDSKWTGPSGQIDSGGIQSVIDKLRDLSAAQPANQFFALAAEHAPGDDFDPARTSPV